MSDTPGLNISSSTATGAPSRRGKRPLHTRIFLGLAIGIAAGVAINRILGGDHLALNWILANITEPVGQLFLRLLLMTVIPLVFSSLVVGVAGLGDVRKLGRIGVKSFVYCGIISVISVAIALTLVNVIQPGKRLDPVTAAGLQERYGADAQKKVADAQKSGTADSVPLQAIKLLVPANPIAAVAGETPNMLHLMVFAVIFGVALTFVGSEKTAGLVSAMEGVYAVSAKIIDLIMVFAPYAVACLLFNNTARFGLDLLGALGWFVATVMLGFVIHMFGTYSLSVALLSRISPIDFFRRIKTALLTAFSTSSSVATLPTTLRVSEEKLGVPREINSFVLTIGATANQNGTAIYEGVTVLFLAQLAGVDLTLGQQLLVAGLAILGGFGTAGVPSGSIPFIVVVLVGINVNPTLIAIILGVDRILDMCRTTLNVAGDITAATYVARSEGVKLLGSKAN